MQPAGNRVLRLAATCFGDDVAHRVFEPLLADWQREWLTTTPGPGRVGVWLGGAVALLRCTAAVGLGAARPHAEDWPGLWRSLAVASGFLVLGIGVLLVPILPWWLDRGAAFLLVLRHVVLIALAFALPFSLLPAALLLGSRVTGPATWRARMALAVVAVAVSGFLAFWQGWAVPALHSDFHYQMDHARAGVAAAYNAPAQRIALLGYPADAFRGNVERRRRAATTTVWPAALVFLGWRVGRRWHRVSAAAMVGWWLVPVAIAFVYQPTATPFSALHPMGWLQTPEFSAAAVWCALGLAIRPRSATASRPLPLQRP